LIFAISAYGFAFIATGRSTSVLVRKLVIRFSRPGWCRRQLQCRWM